MRHTRVTDHVAVVLLLIELGSGWLAELLFQGPDAGRSPYSAQHALLSAEQVAKKLQERNAQRAAALSQLSGTRIYHMQYRGFPGDRDAEMVVNAIYHAPSSKEFIVVSQSGSEIDHRLGLQETAGGPEQEVANEENRRNTALNQHRQLRVHLRGI